MGDRDSDPDHAPVGGDSGIDVRALLSAVVDKPPPDDLTDRVMARLALVETVTEFARLFGLVPAKVATDAVGKDQAQDEAESDDDD